MEVMPIKPCLLYFLSMLPKMYKSFVKLTMGFKKLTKKKHLIVLEAKRKGIDLKVKLFAHKMIRLSFTLRKGNRRIDW